MTYVCENAVGPSKTCTFRSNAVILQQPIDRTQITKLLATGKTDLLEKFVSKRNGRTFKAFLVLDKDGNIGFEFAPREQRKGGRAAKPTEPRPKSISPGKSHWELPALRRPVFEERNRLSLRKQSSGSETVQIHFGKVILNQPIERTRPRNS